MQSYIKFISILMMLYSSILSGKDRARDLGIPFSGLPGTNNAITTPAAFTWYDRLPLMYSITTSLECFGSLLW